MPLTQPSYPTTTEALVDHIGESLEATETGTLSAVRVLGSDDTTGMQARLNTAGGELVQFRDNTYTLTAPLLVNHRQRVTGNGYQTKIVPASGQPAFDCRGQGIEIGNLRIGQPTAVRPGTATHGILIDAANNISSGFYEHYHLHDLDFEYLKGYAIKGLNGFRQSRIKRINAMNCGDTAVPTIWMESFTTSSDQINYLKFRDIELLAYFGPGMLFRSNQGSAARVGCYGCSIKDSVLHGGDPTNNWIGVANAHALVLDGASDFIVDDMQITNQEKTTYGVHVTGATLASLRNSFMKMRVGGVHGGAAAADPTQTGGIGVYVDRADTCDFDFRSTGLTKDYEFTALSNRNTYQFAKVGSDTTTGTDGSTTNFGVPIQRANTAMGGKRIVTVGTAGTSSAIGFGTIGSTNQPGIYFSDPTPEGAVSAAPGSIYLRRTGGATTTLYVKETGTGNTGWVAK